MSKNRFDFEQQIFRCWNVTQDIDTLLEGVVEKDLSKDQIVNALMGIHQLYELRFEKLFDMFEDGIDKQNVSYHNQYKDKIVTNLNNDQYDPNAGFGL